MEAFSFFKSMLLKIILEMFFVMLCNTHSLSPSSVSEGIYGLVYLPAYFVQFHLRPAESSSEGAAPRSASGKPSRDSDAYSSLRTTVPKRG